MKNKTKQFKTFLEMENFLDKNANKFIFYEYDIDKLICSYSIPQKNKSQMTKKRNHLVNTIFAKLFLNI